MLTQHSLRNATVVITDATSRTGRATAHTFARQGARLVLAARHVEDLNQLAIDCRQLGAEVLVVAADAAQPAAMQRLTKAANAFGGRIDVWVDGAGSGAGKPLGAAGSDLSASGSGLAWLAAAVMAGVAGGWFAWRRLAKQDDFSYYVTGGQL
ncbi:SDR family NAD(P)-dependent oxidoreductase [Hymenobacter negativus]|uniref:SDR family NAD(P)-dependent oxidoreductase n=1 Tax=Hymenobacter negativus TaxID=2795026 RepID=A0ABS3QDB5_9BACT|nr:SDR family NAD(P)-dependent oxidoreductase [Hymenobacter negativus]MBO2009230.1 SDR family NAD(P)-dependent oxidoreductase [Hymenobacter negativus]